MSDQQQQQTQPPAPQPPQPPVQQQQQMSQPQQQQQQIQQQQPRVSTVGTVSIQGMVAPQAPTPQPTLTAATNALRSPSTPIPQLQVISQTMHGQSYLPQFQSYAQPFMLQNANALAAMQQMNQLNLAMQHQQQQQQNRAAGGANPGSPGGILSPTAATQMPTHVSLGNGGSLISSTLPGLISQTPVANGSTKAQGNGGKGQAVQGQGQNATAAIASMVAKQPTVLPAQQTAAAQPVVLGQIGVFSNQTNASLGSSFVPQCTVSTHQGGLRLNQTPMVNSAGQIITSQPMQSILTNQAIMQAMASLQMQQGIPLAAATGHQQILNPTQSQMPTIYAGQNFLIRAPGPLPPQPITMTSMQAAFAGMKTPQPQQQPQAQPQQPGKQTNVAGKVMLPSVSRTPMTAKIQPSISQPAKLNVPGVPKPAKARPKAKTTTSTTAGSPSTTTAVKSAVAAATTIIISATTSTATVVSSIPTAASAVVTVAAALPIQTPPVNDSAPPTLTRVPVPAVSQVVAQSIQTKSQSDSEVETGQVPTVPTSSVTVDPALKAKIKATVVASPSTSTLSDAPAASIKPITEAAPAAKLSPLMAGEKLTIGDIVMEEKPVISEVVESGGSINAAMEAAGLMTLVKETKPMLIPELLPLIQQPPVVERQRAIVKPQILTHIIEGFIIQEGPEPFPVQQSSLLQEFVPPKASSQIMKESEEEGTSCDDEPPTLLSQVDAHLSSTQLLSHQPQEHTGKDQEQKSPIKLLKCELCQKVVPASSFNNSQRFCSLSCSRRHNVSHTRRVGPLKPRGSSRKRKHMLGRKNWRISKGGRLTYAKTSTDNNSHDEHNDDTNAAVIGDEMSSSNSTRETSSSADSPLRSQEFDMEVDANIPRTDPGKWTVTEVYEFIQSMPGCREYAEEFRSQEIDGQALLLLKEDHLMTAMNIKLGPALKICSKINSLKSESGTV